MLVVVLVVVLLCWLMKIEEGGGWGWWLNCVVWVLLGDGWHFIFEAAKQPVQ